MRLFEAIIEANHRALAGDQKAGVHPTDFADSLPLIALTCIDPRLNRLFPGVLGLPEDKFIWLRNAGNIITSPLSSTMRSLALACAVKQGREIAVIGHTDCHIRQTSIADLIERFKALGIQRQQLPENLTDFFGVFSSEQQNVIRAVDHVRSSPIIGSKIPVHGLLVDIETGRLSWVVNGYESLERSVAHAPPGIKMPSIGVGDELASIGNQAIGALKFPDGKIGEVAAEAKRAVAETPVKVRSGQPSPVATKVRIEAPPPVNQPPVMPAPRPPGKWGMRRD